MTRPVRDRLSARRASIWRYPYPAGGPQVRFISRSVEPASGQRLSAPNRSIRPEREWPLANAVRIRELAMADVKKFTYGENIPPPPKSHSPRVTFSRRG